MKNFLAVFLGEHSGAKVKAWEALDEKTRAKKEQEGMQAWMKWGMDNQKSIVQMGSPLGTTKAIGPDGISDTTNLLAAWVLVRAESHDTAAKLFLNHPHFTIFPGDSVEVMECLPIPGR